MPREFQGVTGWAALRWLGAAWNDGTVFPHGVRDVEIVTGLFHQRGRPGISISAERLDWPDLVVVDGLRITRPTRSVAFLARYAADLAAAVRIIDMAAYNDLISLAELASHADEHLNGWTGVPQLRAALALADENAWSPTEVDFRLLWELAAGLGRPHTNVPVFDLDGRHIGTPDLLDPIAGVAGDYDGELHLEGAQRARDVRRQGVFLRHGLEHVTMLAGDRRQQGEVVARLHDAYRRAGRRAASERRWTTKAPPWWTPTSTVSQRRALDDRQRARLLALRLRAS